MSYCIDPKMHVSPLVRAFFLPRQSIQHNVIIYISAYNDIDCTDSSKSHVPSYSRRKLHRIPNYNINLFRLYLHIYIICTIKSNFILIIFIHIDHMFFLLTLIFTPLTLCNKHFDFTPYAISIIMFSSSLHHLFTRKAQKIL